MCGVDPPLATLQSIVRRVSPVVWLGMATGFVGVASGFAVFFLTLDDGTPLQFLGILVVATLLSFLVEYLRELIDTTPEEYREHRSRSSKVIVSLLIVALAELFALGWHGAIASWGTSKFEAVTQIVMGGALSSDHTTAVILAGLIALWMVSGVSLAAVLAQGIGPSDAPDRTTDRERRRTGRRGRRRGRADDSVSLHRRLLRAVWACICSSAIRARGGTTFTSCRTPWATSAVLPARSCK